MKIDALVNEIYEMVNPIAEELNYDIYHIEYVKENGEYLFKNIYRKRWRHHFK